MPKWRVSMTEQFPCNDRFLAQRATRLQKTVKMQEVGKKR
jgi:hypothetical protein